MFGVDQDRILKFQETMSSCPLSLLQPLQLPYLHVIISVSSNGSQELPIRRSFKEASIHINDWPTSNLETSLHGSQ